METITFTMLAHTHPREYNIGMLSAHCYTFTRIVSWQWLLNIFAHSTHWMILNYHPWVHYGHNYRVLILPQNQINIEVPLCNLLLTLNRIPARKSVQKWHSTCVHPLTTSWKHLVSINVKHEYTALVPHSCNDMYQTAIEQLWKRYYYFTFKLFKESRILFTMWFLNASMKTNSGVNNHKNVTFVIQSAQKHVRQWLCCTKFIQVLRRHILNHYTSLSSCTSYFLYVSTTEINTHWHPYMK